MHEMREHNPRVEPVLNDAPQSPAYAVRHADEWNESAFDDAPHFGREDQGTLAVLGALAARGANRLIDRMLRAPATAALSALTLVAFTVVGINALYLQSGAHPAPILATRDSAAADRIPATQPSQIYALERPTGSVQDVGPRVQPANYGLNGAVPEPVGGAGRYNPPSPVPDPRFSAGTPVPQTTASVAAAPARQVETVPTAPQIFQGIAGLVWANAPQAVRDAVQSQTLPRGGSPVVFQVQTILSELGYAPGALDGRMNDETEHAIRRFQLSRALEPHGRIDALLIDEIQRITGRTVTAGG